MAGAKLNTYAVGDVDLTNIMEVLDACRQGYHKVSLTEWATTTIPAIAAGSKIEINGALFVFDAEEAIGGAPANGDIYIKLTPVADAVTAAFTATPPTWDDEKGGWYEAGTNNRYCNFRMKKADAVYTNKNEFPNSPRIGGSNFGDLTSYYSYDGSTEGIEIVTISGNSTKEFYCLKPISFGLRLYNGTLYSRTVGHLNPGYHRLVASAANDKVDVDLRFNNTWYTLFTLSGTGVTGTCDAVIYLMGVYGIDCVTDLNKIRTLI